MNLMDIQGRVTPEQSGTHLRIPFQLTADAERMNIRFAYSPKVLEDRERALALLEASFAKYVLPDQQERVAARAETYLPLNNLITVSLDDEHQYRGACHRHDPVQELHLSELHASPGLVRGLIKPGSWTVTLSIHCIVTDACDYRLEVWTDETGVQA